MSPEEIRALRDKLNLTQQQLAQMVGVHPMTVSKWERGTATPTLYNQQQLRLLAEGADEMDSSDFEQFMQLLVMGAAAGALAYVIYQAIEASRKRKKKRRS